MVPDLPTHLLRTFVAVVEAGSLAKASVRVGRSVSALSQHVARLEADLGRPLFARDGRALTVTPFGTRLLGHARLVLARIDAARADLGVARAEGAVRVGIVQDFVFPLLLPALSALRADTPDVELDVVVGTSAELLGALGEARIDLAVCASDAAGDADGPRLSMDWLGDAQVASAEVVPLVTVPAPCPYLTAARRALDLAGRPYRLAVVTPSLEGVRAAVSAGLGIACRTRIGLDLPRVPEAAGLPPLPAIRYALVRRPGASPASLAFAGRLSAGLVDLATRTP